MSSAASVQLRDRVDPDRWRFYRVVLNEDDAQFVVTLADEAQGGGGQLGYVDLYVKVGWVVARHGLAGSHA